MSCAAEAGDPIAAHGSPEAVGAIVHAIGELIGETLLQRPPGRTICKRVGNAGQGLFAAAEIMAHGEACPD